MAERWVIIGAGSAGCVLANRLSANPDHHVTLLDDGPALSPGAVPPGINSASFFDALAEPGRIHADLVATRTAGSPAQHYQRGRGIGGSSAVNAMVALPGSAALYASWGWTDTEAAFDAVQLATEQPAADELGALGQALLQADSAAQVVDLTRRHGRRVTSAEAYLWPVLDRPNLQVQHNTGVARINLDGQSATGVTLHDDRVIEADHLVLAAGAIHTPALLLRSGVGTPGIGTGLQDHPSAVITLALHGTAHHDPHAVPIAAALHRTIDRDLIQFLPMSHLGPNPEARGLGALLVALMTPTSKSGTVTIDSTGNPIVDFAFLSTEHDVTLMIDAVRQAQELLDLAPFDDIVTGAFIDDQGTPLTSLRTDDDIRSWLRTSCGDYVHASSSCAMGTVVDSNFGVVGYQHLFVCDASVFPTIPDANTHLPTTMLAERFALRHIYTSRMDPTS